jgi:hypothetical protein
MITQLTQLVISLLTIIAPMMKGAVAADDSTFQSEVLLPYTAAMIDTHTSFSAP